MSQWFVMIRHPQGHPLPMTQATVSDDEAVALFESEAEADRVAERQRFAAVHGWETYEWPD